MTTNLIPAFLNGRQFPVSPGTTLRKLLAEHEPELHAALANGTAAATDARGLPVDPDAPVAAGAIYRVSRSARHAQGDVDA